MRSRTNANAAWQACATATPVFDHCCSVFSNQLWKLRFERKAIPSCSCGSCGVELRVWSPSNLKTTKLERRGSTSVSIHLRFQILREMHHALPIGSLLYTFLCATPMSLHPVPRPRCKHAHVRWCLDAPVRHKQHWMPPPCNADIQTSTR